jgi:hypothetical protein
MDILKILFGLKLEECISLQIGGGPSILVFIFFYLAQYEWLLFGNESSIAKRWSRTDIVLLSKYILKNLNPPYKN